jgi:rubrerythrin
MGAGIPAEGAAPEAFAADGRTRREALGRGLVLGGALVGAASAPALLGARTALAAADDDARILAAAIRLEQSAVVVYATAATSGLLGPRLEAVARRFRDQEQEHADALTAALRQIGGRPPLPPRPAQIAGLRALRTREQVLSFAVDLELEAVAAYYEAHQKLADPALLRTGAQIMANEGQHLVVLRQALGRQPLPDAFETGQA